MGTNANVCNKLITRLNPASIHSNTIVLGFFFCGNCNNKNSNSNQRTFLVNDKSTLENYFWRDILPKSDLKKVRIIYCMTMAKESEKDKDCTPVSKHMSQRTRICIRDTFNWILLLYYRHKWAHTRACTHIIRDK